MKLAAMDYAEHGFRLVPNHDTASGRCSCGKPDCGSVGKHPRIGEWQHKASCDLDLVRQWWTRWPHANIGILCGDWFAVLDVDGDKGRASLDELENKYGPLPRTAEARSASGGTHFLFAHPGGTVQNKVGLMPGLDIRGDGGQILVEPSRTLKGEYRWIRHPENVELANLPVWLYCLISAKVVAA